MTTQKPAVPPGAAKQANVARFTSNGQDVLLRYDVASSSWRRAMPEEFYAAGQSLLELPCYRSRVDIFAVGATIDLLGGTHVEILQGGPQGPLGVAIDFGCMVVKPLAQAGARLRVIAGPHTGVVTLASLESVAAFEVTRVPRAGHRSGKSPFPRAHETLRRRRRAQRGKKPASALCS